jgi:hypothetical protein
MSSLDPRVIFEKTEVGAVNLIRFLENSNRSGRRGLLASESAKTNPIHRLLPHFVLYSRGGKKQLEMGNEEWGIKG